MYSWNIDKYSVLWENGRFKTIQECVEDAKKYGYKAGEEIYVGKCIDFEVNINADDIIERLQEQAFEECGEASDGWIDWKNDNVEVLSERLTSCVNEWLKETKQEPCFYHISEIEKVVVN